MRTIALAIALVVGLILPAFAQKVEIEAANAKWIDFFNKGDFAGVASLYTDDATAFPPGSGMVKGRAAIETGYVEGRNFVIEYRFAGNQAPAEWASSTASFAPEPRCQYLKSRPFRRT